MEVSRDGEHEGASPAGGAGPARAQGALRALDANANRAREALRTLEDVARFVLDDAALCAECKALRHELTRALREAGLDEARLLTLRDTPGDEGTETRGVGEFQRAGLAGVVEAAGSRLGEALRVVEEMLKTLPSADGGGGGGGGGPAQGVMRARYRGYEVARAVRARLGAGRAVQWRVCVLLSAALCAHHPWERVAALAIEGGADALQLREKSLPDAELLARARALVALARPRGVAVIVNDRPDVALLSGADGVHVGQGDLPVREVRALAGAALLVGVSCATLEHALAAREAGADVIGLGPMFPSTTKPKDALSGPALLRAVLGDARTAGVPHLAISGVTPANVGELRAAGCLGVAVSGVVCGAADPAGVCRALRAGLEGGAGER